MTLLARTAAREDVSDDIDEHSPAPTRAASQGAAQGRGDWPTLSALAVLLDRPELDADALALLRRPRVRHEARAVVLLDRAGVELRRYPDIADALARSRHVSGARTLVAAADGTVFGVVTGPLEDGADARDRVEDEEQADVGQSVDDGDEVELVEVEGDDLGDVGA